MSARARRRKKTMLVKVPRVPVGETTSLTIEWWGRRNARWVRLYIDGKRVKP